VRLRARRNDELGAQVVMVLMDTYCVLQQYMLIYDAKSFGESTTEVLQCNTRPPLHTLLGTHHPGSGFESFRSCGPLYFSCQLWWRSCLLYARQLPWSQWRACALIIDDQTERALLLPFSPEHWRLAQTAVLISIVLLLFLAVMGPLSCMPRPPHSSCTLGTVWLRVMCTIFRRLMTPTRPTPLRKVADFTKLKIHHPTKPCS
jgi:hypothetical protein